ncbi:MAG: hypothetical protein AB1414_08940, partial [bacterium]
YSLIDYLKRGTSFKRGFQAAIHLPGVLRPGWAKVGVQLFKMSEAPVQFSPARSDLGANKMLS